MKPIMTCAALAASLLLSGCLEVPQHVAYADGGYAGKRDNRVADVGLRGDSAAWRRAIDQRARMQNEFNRTTP